MNDSLMATLRGPHDLALSAELCAELTVSEHREWFVANGTGGYACGTIARLPTRRYHGLLIAATSPPGGRTLLVPRFEEIVVIDGASYDLAAARWRDGTIAPRGFTHIERFFMDGGVPTWTFSCGPALVEKRIWMEAGRETTYVTYRIIHAEGAMLRCKTFVAPRNHHELLHGTTLRAEVDRIPGGLSVAFPNGMPTTYLLAGDAVVHEAHEWYRDLFLAREAERGLDSLTDELHVGTFVVDLPAGRTFAFALSTDPATPVPTDGAVAAYARRSARDAELIAGWCASDGAAVTAQPPPEIARPALAADAFIIRVPSATGTRPAIVAGYPWFGEWSRDAVIALPGLLLATGRALQAADLLRTLAASVRDGLLPNYLPDDPQAVPEYNAVDAPLLWIEAVRRVDARLRDDAFVRDVFPALAAIVRAYQEGTHHGIGVDARDGLVRAGAGNDQLTWMDARVNGRPVTPRHGKPVEVNALWYAALRTAAALAPRAHADASEYAVAAETTRSGLARFWNGSEGHLFDVLDGPGGSDLALRPNQLFAVSLADRAFTPEQERSIVDACTRALLTPAGLRTLAAGSPGYVGRYGGGIAERDGAYHQGTVWPWLIAPWTLAARNAGYCREDLLLAVRNVAMRIGSGALGTLPEVADGDVPHFSHGCFAQAWSVGAVLEAWEAIGPPPAVAKPKAKSRRKSATAPVG